ncbi:Pre-mRNA-splicing factor cwc21 [Penicillium canariense]|uniref:Pre-mRNA-splicing factor cwc21 n=1 Tax=Penicillium canariense TaxID=189055 RepID=A0A9W9I4B8_9EURO|nr:Pre-mRNA-splicing factor cwc21 [Penicillium canariense]KAJ5166400.1 Pre-mRNA-splicing factor cwc21 [Penicillium canariense]
MSSNVGLSTPRGSGTSGYVQRNGAFLKPRAAGFGAPYPPLSGANGSDRAFKQRLPDKQILEHDRRRAIEVTVMEERERLEDENERMEEAVKRNKSKSLDKKGTAQKQKPADDKEDGEEDEDENEGERVLSEEEIDERCEALRQKLLKEMEAEVAGAGAGASGRKGGAGPKDRRLKAYQVHELAEAKIQESERLRRALGIREDRETGEISSRRGERRRD